MSNDQKVEIGDAIDASGYRSRWLFAHNRLHALVHEGKSPSEQWDSYLEELKTADEVATYPA